MNREQTAAERYLSARLDDSEYRASYEAERRRIDQVDDLIRRLNDRRDRLELSKADLARRAGMRPEAIRRLFSAENPNPTLHTLVSLAGALELEITVAPARQPNDHFEPIS